MVRFLGSVTRGRMRPFSTLWVKKVDSWSKTIANWVRERTNVMHALKSSRCSKDCVSFVLPKETHKRCDRNDHWALELELRRRV